MARVLTYEQPLRSILRRWRVAGVTWAELECGHTEPATGYDLATGRRCQQCNPIMKPFMLNPPRDQASR